MFLSCERDMIIIKQAQSSNSINTKYKNDHCYSLPTDTHQNYNNVMY